MRSRRDLDDADPDTTRHDAPSELVSAWTIGREVGRGSVKVTMRELVCASRQRQTYGRLDVKYFGAGGWSWQN